MDEKDFSGIISKSKLASLTLLGILFYVGYKLLVASTTIVSTTGIGGSIILGIACVLSLISFLDYRYKEHTDGTIDHLSKANNALLRTVRATSATTILDNRNRQHTFKTEGKSIGMEDKRLYKTTGEEETSTGEEATTA